MWKNEACILSSEFTESWVARKRWVDGMGPNLELLLEDFSIRLFFGLLI
jgi:hypothetical protein